MDDGRGAFRGAVVALLSGGLIASACGEQAPTGNVDSMDQGGSNATPETVAGVAGDASSSTAGSTNTVHSTGGGPGGDASGVDSGGSATGGAADTGGRTGGPENVAGAGGGQGGDASGAGSGGSATGGAGGATSCSGILLNNDGPPENYPATYREAAGAGARFDAAKAELLSTYGLQEIDYVFLTAPITWAAQMESGTLVGGPLRLDGGPFDESNTGAATLAFLTEWAQIFGYEGTFFAAGPPSCTDIILSTGANYRNCQAAFAQDYCGFWVHSPQGDSNYNGRATVGIDPADGGVKSVHSSLVPVRPVPRNLVLNEDEIIGAIVGETVTVYCNREISVVPSAQDVFDVSPNPVVFVRTSPTVAAALEYRLAVRVEVTTLDLIVYVDGIDGSLLEVFINVVC